MTEAIGPIRTITLVSKDDTSVVVPLAAAARLSEFIRNVPGCGEEEENEDHQHADPISIPVRKVSGECLNKVAEFFEHYDQEPMNEIPTPFNGPTTFEDVMSQEWYQHFVRDLPKGLLFELLEASNFMGIHHLLDLVCLKMTFDLADKSAAEIRDYLGLPELTPEEEARAREEHAWIFEGND